MPEISTYDVIMFVVLLLATLFGFWKGLIWQACSLGSLVISFYFSARMSSTIAPLIKGDPPWNQFLAMLIVFLVTSIVIWSICRLLSNFLDRLKLKEFDHQMGGILGFAKGCLLCIAITFFAVALMPDDQKEAILTSKSGHYIGVAIHHAPVVMPDEIHGVLEPYLEGLHDELHPDHAEGPAHEHAGPEVDDEEHGPVPTSIPAG